MFHPARCLVFAIGALGLRGGHANAEPAAAKPARTRVVMSQALQQAAGDHLRATLVEINYEPGGSSPAHSHSCPAMVYVVEGAIRSKVNGEPEAIHRAGESFYEAANGTHEVSANASAQVPAKFLAFFVCDHDGPLTTPAPPARGAKAP